MRGFRPPTRGKTTRQVQPWLGYSRKPDKAELETGLADLPKTCPWTIDQVLSHNFMPDVPTPIP